MIGSFFVKRTGADEFTAGMLQGEGFSIVAERDENENVRIGIEADFFRTRSMASGNDLLDGTKGIGGLTFVASVGQVKKIVTQTGSYKITLENAE